MTTKNKMNNDDQPDAFEVELKELLEKYCCSLYPNDWDGIDSVPMMTINYYIDGDGHELEAVIHVDESGICQ